jgi:hypothetical protein
MVADPAAATLVAHCPPPPVLASVCAVAAALLVLSAAVLAIAVYADAVAAALEADVRPLAVRAPLRRVHRTVDEQMLGAIRIAVARAAVVHRQADTLDDVPSQRRGAHTELGKSNIFPPREAVVTRCLG